MARDLITLRRPADVADVQMSGEKQIGPDRGQLGHRHLRAPDQLLRVMIIRQIKGMVRDDDLDHVRRHGAETIGRLPDLSRVQPAAAEAERSGAVQAERRYFRIDEHRFQIVGDEPAISGQRPQEAPGHVVERHVVISRHHEAGARQRLKKITRLGELTGARALREISRHGDQIRRDRADRGHEGRDDAAIQPAEMKIR